MTGRQAPIEDTTVPYSSIYRVLAVDRPSAGVDNLDRLY